MTDKKYYIYGKALISDEGITNYENSLKQRLEDVCNAVDSHMELLLQATRKRDVTKWRFFMTSKDTGEKLETLLQSDNLKYFNELVAKCSEAEKYDLDNMRRLRMKGSTQSYHLTDSPAFEKARVMEIVLQQRNESEKP